MPRKITPPTSLDNFSKEAKRWLKELRSGSPEARGRLENAYPGAPDRPVLRQVQHALAREYGFESWVALKAAVETLPESAASATPLCSAEEYQRLARDWVSAGDERNEAALQRLNQHYQRTFSFDDLRAEIWRRVYAFRQRSSKVDKNYLQLSEAQILIAQDVGFSSWEALIRAATTGAPRVPAYQIDPKEGRIAPRRRLNDKEWDELIGMMREHRISRLESQGLMTDAVLARVAALDHVTALSLGGSLELSDDGLAHLARMPQLEQLNLSEHPGGKLTDRGLRVLGNLPNLRTFEMTWQRGISDAGVAHLRHCERLESVDLMGSPTGDGAIQALRGKPKLSRFSSGRLVTDAGLRLLHEIPHFKKRPAARGAVGGEDVQGCRLLIDGPFTDQGLAGLSGLEGVRELDLFWHVTNITPDGFAHLVGLPNLEALGADGKLSDNVSLRHMAAMPRLRRLRAQEAAADDDGFEALSRSRTLAHFWGRECPGFGSRGFIAFSKMPALRSLGVGCRNVDDRALSRLPQFPSLRELTPIGFQDDGFAHIGRCPRLERLTCMYCRETGDAATRHIADLRLKYYYAGLTRITDRSLEVLGRMQSLQQVDLYECNGVTDAGLVYLKDLPRLREIHLDSLPGVTFEGTRVFPKHVRVLYST